MQGQLATWFWRLLRWLYAAYFMYVGYIVLGKLLHGAAIHMHQPNSTAQAFSDALEASGFMYPTLAACYLVGGLALLFQRTAPLGLAILGPSVVIILFFHTFLTGMYAWGAGWALVWLLMFWRYRKSFIPLWSYGV
ncbi:MAG: hypothetical protein DYH18_03020 [Xanthomonadales bacterium PRO7]|nr:hypothetical protein [Xanthomonadales bacterium PRO7]